MTFSCSLDNARHVTGCRWAKAVSRLARDGFRAQSQHPETNARLKSKYSVLPARDEIITNEHVRRLVDDEGI